MLASKEGHVECIKMLLKGGAQANQQRKVRLVQCLVGDLYPCELWQ